MYICTRFGGESLSLAARKRARFRVSFLFLKFIEHIGRDSVNKEKTNHFGAGQIDFLVAL